MKKHIILRKKAFESIEKFEARINATQGYEAVNISSDNSTLVVLMKRITS